MKNARFLFLIFAAIALVLVAGEAFATGNLTMEKDRVDMTGDLSISGQYGGRIYVVGNVSGATTINWDNGNSQHITLTGNTSLTFSNGRSGTKHTLIIKQDGTGSRTVTWPSGAGGTRWSGGSATIVSTVANTTDYYGFIYNSVDDRYDCVGVQQAYTS